MIRIFKRKSKLRNIYNSEYSNKIEAAFKIDGVQYYRFKEGEKLPHMRAFYFNWYVNQYEMGVDHSTLMDYLDRMDGLANKGKLGDVIVLIRLLIERTKANMGMDVLYEIASVFYFTDEEDLEEYSISKNKSKVATFRKNKDLSFFLTSPMTSLFPRLPSFVDDLEGFLKTLETTRDLTSEIDSLAFSPSVKE